MSKDVKGKAPEAEAKKKPEVKAEPVKTDAKAAVANTAEPKKAETAPVKKAEPKKEAVSAKKPAAKPVKKTVKEKVSLEPEVYVQYTDNGEQEAGIADIVAKIKASYVAEGHRESSIKSLKVYVKPQEWKAYYVINDKVEGNIMMF